MFVGFLFLGIVFIIWHHFDAHAGRKLWHGCKIILLVLGSCTATIIHTMNKMLR